VARGGSGARSGGVELTSLDASVPVARGAAFDGSVAEFLFGRGFGAACAAASLMLGAVCGSVPLLLSGGVAPTRGDDGRRHHRRWVVKVKVASAFSLSCFCSQSPSVVGDRVFIVVLGWIALTRLWWSGCSGAAPLVHRC
jgi:hypothetical protein